MAKSKKYDFRISESRYPDLYKWLEALPKGDRSYWIVEMLARGMAATETTKNELWERLFKTPKKD